MSATSGAMMPDSSTTSDGYLDMSHDVYNAIMKTHGAGNKGKEALLSEFLSHHPYPRWELIVELLAKLEVKGKARAGLAQEMKEKHLTSE